MWRKRPDPFPLGCGLGTRLRRVTREAYGRLIQCRVDQGIYETDVKRGILKEDYGLWLKRRIRTEVRGATYQSLYTVYA